MAVRRIKSKQRGRWCDWCPPRTVRATRRGYGWGKCACPDHSQQLEEWDRQASAPDYSDAAFYGGY